MNDVVDINPVFFYFSEMKNTVTILLPGGAHEARNWSKNEVKLYLNKRKGFIKHALRFGVDLVPTFSFNEQFIFNQIVAEKGDLNNLVPLRMFIFISLNIIQYILLYIICRLYIDENLQFRRIYFGIHSCVILWKRSVQLHVSRFLQ